MYQFILEFTKNFLNNKTLKDEFHSAKQKQDEFIDEANKLFEQEFALKVNGHSRDIRGYTYLLR